jgi:hypothetical protein
MTKESKQEYLDRQRNEQRESLKANYPNKKELLKLFSPEAGEIIKEKIKEYEAENSYLKKRVAKLLKKPDDQPEITEYLIKKFIIKQIVNNKYQIMRLKDYFSEKSESKYNYHDLEEKKERAKEYPIYEIARQYIDLKQIGKRYLGLCPFHNEKTPSFWIFESNTAYCFGCGIHFDSIELERRFKNISFIEAILNLQ